MWKPCLRKNVLDKRPYALIEATNSTHYVLPDDQCECRIYPIHLIYPTYSDMSITFQSKPYTLVDITYVFAYLYHTWETSETNATSHLEPSEILGFPTMHHCVHLLHPRPLWNNWSGPEKTCQTAKYQAWSVEDLIVHMVRGYNPPLVEIHK